MPEQEAITVGDAARGRGELESPGDVSRDLLETRMISRAIREGWPITPDDKQAVVRKMRAKVDKDFIVSLNAKGEEIQIDNDRNQIAAAKVLLDADKANQTDFWNVDKNERLDTGKATENVGLNFRIVPAMPPQVL